MLQDVLDMWERHDREQEKKREKLPMCCCCHQHIQQEQAVYYNNKWFCEDCEDELWEIVRKDFLEETI